jgi:carboxyl-terminal processing protease
MSLLQEEIAERYYYRKGRIEASFINDKEVQKAIEVLNNTQAYKNYLLPKK